MKKKMKFPDGSVREIDEADVATARSLGAVDFTESVSAPSTTGKKVFMQFTDGQTREVDSVDVAVAESLGAVKKKETSVKPAATSSGDTGQFSSRNLSAANPVSALVRQPETSTIVDYWNEEMQSGDKARIDKAKTELVTLQAKKNPLVITPEDKQELTRLTGVTDPAAQLEVLKARRGTVNSEGLVVFNPLNPALGIDLSTLPAPTIQESEKVGTLADKLESAVTKKKDTRWSNKSVVSIGGKETTDLEDFLNLLNPTSPQAIISDAKRFNSEALNDSFSTGLESIKERQRARYDRITKHILNNEPIPTTDIVELTSIGSKIIDTQNSQEVVDGKITADDYVTSQQALSKDISDNVYRHPDYLRSMISNVISEHYEKDGGVVFSKWMVTDKEIDAVPLNKFAEIGLDPNHPEFKKQLALIKEKEGWMPFQNAIAKDDLFREFRKGALSVPEGIVSTVESAVAPDEVLLADKETAQFNVSETANARGKYFEENYGTWADAFQGLGQFSSQLALMFAGSSAIGAAGRGLGGGTTASNLMNATQLQRLGNTLINSKDLYATYGVPFISTYGDYYKDALSKGANPLQAKMMAFTNASIEGVSETIFDNISFGRQVAKNLFDKQNYTKIAKIFDRGILDDAAQAEYKQTIQEVIGNTLKTVGKSALGAAKESFEEVPVALTNFIVDAAANPANVEGRNPLVEMKDAFLDGLVSFSIPSLLGLGGNLRKQFKEQKSIDESLMIAAMDRPFVTEAINNLVAKGEMTQAEANKKIQILNTAAQQLQEIPATYADGTELTPKDREAYLSLSVKEKVLNEMTKTGDKAVKNIAEQQIDEVTAIKEDILNKKPITDEQETSSDIPATEAPEEKTIFQRASESAAPGIKLLIGEAESPEGLQALNEQALDTPNGLLSGLNNNRELVTDIISQNSEEQINKSINRWTDAITNDTATPEEGDAQISLLEEGLAKKQQQSGLSEVDVNGFKVPKILADELRTGKRVKSSWTDQDAIQLKIPTNLPVGVEPNTAYRDTKKDLSRKITEPIEVIFNPATKEWNLVDGNNRLAQARANGEKEILANVSIINEDDEGEQTDVIQQSELPVDERMPTKKELKNADQIVSKEDAEARLSNGERIFAFHEMDEGGEPVEIKNVDELTPFAPDQLLALPRKEDPFKPADQKKQVKKAIDDFIKTGKEKFKIQQGDEVSFFERFGKKRQGVGKVLKVLDNGNYIVNWKGDEVVLNPEEDTIDLSPFNKRTASPITDETDEPEVAAPAKGRGAKIRSLLVQEEPPAPAEAAPEAEIKKAEPKTKKEKPAKAKKEVKEAARKVRDENIKKEIDSAWDEFLKGDDLLTAGGLDPKRIEAGTKLIGLYIKGGVYKFADILEDAYGKFGDKLNDFVDALKSVYSTYYNTQATDQEAELMDPSVRNITLASVINRIEDGKPAHNVEEVTTAVPVSTPRQFVDAVKQQLRAGEKLGIVSLRKLASDRGISVKDTELQEMTELAIVELARDVALSNNTTENRFKTIVRLYDKQPTISMRSSERIDKQQYSTPIPISFLMGDFVNANNPEIVLEPNAGNGMLTIAIPPAKVIANEIDPVRLTMLAEQGFGMVTSQDALDKFPGQYGGLVMNPPFGSKSGVKFDGVEIKGLDEQMVANALTSLLPNGRAAIMIGGHNEYDEKGRLAADRVFLNYLYNRYNVVDIINIDGSLWSKQGTTFPTRVILIDGVKTEKSGVAPLEDKELNKPVTSFDDLFNRIQNAKQNENINKAAGVQPALDTDTDTGDTIPGGVQPRRKKQRATTELSANQDKLLSATKSESERETSPDDRGLADDISRGSGVGVRQSDQGDITDRALAESESEVPARQPEGTTDQQRTSDANLQRNQPVSISDRAGNILNDKVKYRPKSKAKSVDTVIPTQMATETDHTLDAIETIYGDIDTFITKELQYKNKEALHKALSAEQVDAVAIAIHQLKSGQGMIIGDMTGVGKGRIAASIIRYGVINGYKPIFLTEKPNLFSDLHRDMVAIGSDKLVPFIVNDQNPDNDPNIKDQNGVVVHKSFGGNRKKIILNAGVIPKDFDYTVSTYSQFRTAMDKPSLKRDFFLKNTIGNILIMDESHNASGESNAGELFQNALPNASGVIFLSATFAKRPDNMPVYAMKTAMADANMSREELVEAIRRGGVALQEVVSANLVQSGQMIRRERDFTGVKVDYNVLEEFKGEHRKTADGITSIVRDIIKFEDRYVMPVLDGIDSELAAQQAGAEKRKGTKSVGVSNVPFASKTFNLINQLLFSIKSKQIAQAAIKAHKEGKKPVIGFLSTMESFLNSMGVTSGEKLDKADFALVLKRGLEGTMKYTIRNPEGENVQASLSVSDLTPEGQRQYRRLLDDIRGVTSGIHISPIDVMTKELKDAGLRVGEITGRNKYLEIQDDGSSIVKERQERDINTIARKFNSGEIDVILLNASGATGISLHASQDFKDQRPRVLISGQLELDINKEVQKRGRIDRTGQLHRGEFQYVVSSIPAEQRLLMMFKAKLKSLDANTTSSQKSKSNQLDVVDFLNKYGDEIVTQYVKENSEFNEKIQDPFGFASISEEDLSDIKKIENAASRVTSRVAILPTNEQEQFYSEIIEAYKSYITHLNDNNENDLEVNLLPLNATTKERVEVIAGRGTDSPFGSPSIREKVEVDVLTKPMKKTEIDAEVAKYLDGRERNEVRDQLLRELSAYEEEFIADKTNKIENHYNDEVIPETIARLEKKKDVTADEIEAKRNELEEAKDKRIERERLKYQSIFGSVENSMRTFTPGGVYKIPVSSRIDTNTFFSNGIFLGFQIKEGSVNKYTPSNIVIRFAVNDGRRLVNVPLSKSDYVNAIIANSRYSDDRGTVLKDWDNKISNKTRTTRYIITGNLLQAYGTNDGQLASFTTEGGAIRKGMILPDSYEAGKQKFRTTISRAFTDNVDRVVSSDDDVVVERDRGGYLISVPLSKQRGGKYFLDETLRSFVVGNDFNQRGGKMVGMVNENNIRPLLLALDAMGVTSESDIAPRAEKPAPEPTSLGDTIRQAKIRLGGLQSNIAGIPIALYNAAIETIATAVDAGMTITQAIKKAIADHKLDKQKNFDRKEFIRAVEDASGEQFDENEGVAPKETIAQDDKSILARMMKSNKVSDDVKDRLKASGLKYKIRTQKEARAAANSVIDEFGIDDAVTMAEGGRFHGDVNSMIFAVSLDKVFAEEQAGTTPEQRQVAAEKWAGIAIRYQDAAESGGRFISAINDFYKKSPAGLVIKIQKEFDRRRDEYFEGREKPTKEAWEEFINTVEGKELLEQEIEKRKKEGSRIFSPESEKKIKSFFSKLRIDTKGTAGSYLLPPQLYNKAIDIIEGAVLGGLSIGKAIDQALDYINDNFKGTWQVKEFKKDIRDGFKNQNVQKVLTESEKDKILKKWQRKLGGLNAEERNSLLNRAFLELAENGALEYDDFKQMYAEAAGLPQMTPELSRQLIDLANKINEPDKIKELIVNNKDLSLRPAYEKAIIEAEKASTTLNDLIGKQKWWVNTFLTVMRLNTLGAVSLLGNIAYNVAALPVRFATNLTATGLDYLLAGVQLTSDKIFGTDLYKHPPLHNVFNVQGGFVRGGWLGTKTAVKQFFTGLTNRDYFQKEIKQNIKPLTSAKRLIRSMTGKEKLSLNEKLNAFIEAFPTMGMSAEVIARALNVGDKPFRYAAEYAAAERLARQKGLSGIDREIFILFPDEDSEKKIKEEGEKIVFQQKNIVTKMLDSAGNTISNFVNELGWETKALHGIGKTLGYATQPFLNTPLNVFNEFIHYAFPPLPLYKAGKAMVAGDAEKATYHLAQAVTGMSIAYAAGILAASGLIVPAGGDDEEAKERLGIQTYQRRGQLNVSGLKRWLAGEAPENQDGDVWVDLRYYGFVGMMMLSKAKQYKGKTKEEIEQDTYVQDMVGQFIPAVKIGLTEGVFSGTSSLINAMSMGGGYVDNYLLGMGNVVVNAFEPQWLRQISLASNEYYRDPKGMTLPETAKNQLKQRFFMGDQLPARVNIWGNKVEAVPNNTNPYLYNVFGLNKAAVFDNDRFGFVLYDYYNKTKDYNIFPPALRREVNGKSLSPEEFEEFSILVGSHRKQLVAPFIENGSFEQLRSQEGGHQKLVDELTTLYNKGREVAVREFANIHPEFQKPKKQGGQNAVQE